jgi:hypothetical protein
MRHTFSTLTVLCVLATCSAVSAQSRVWRDVYGNVSTGTFQRFTKDKKGDAGNDRVVVRAAGRIVGLKFWELMPDSQQFVIDQLRGDSEGDHLEITDVPHDWTSRSGVKGTGQFLKVEKNGKIAVVIASEKKLFEFAEFCDEDQDYIRSVLARSGKEDLVPAKPEAPDSPTNTAPTSTPGTPFTPPGFPTPPAIPSIPGQPNFPSSPPPGFGSPNSSIPNSSGPSSSSIGSGGSFTTTTPPSTSHPTSSFPTSSFPDATSNMPGHSAPDTSRFEPPQVQASDILVPTFEEVYSCSSCGKDVSKVATRCPHCQVRFDYVEDEFGNKTNISGSGSSGFSGRNLRGIVKIGAFIVIGIGGFLIKMFTGRS